MIAITHKYLVYGVGVATVDTLLFTSTNASNVASYVVMVGFLAVAVTLWTVLYGILHALSLYGIAVKRKRRKALYMTGWLSGLVALQSIGELSSRDMLVLLPLLAIGYGYSTYVSATRRNFEG